MPDSNEIEGFRFEVAFSFAGPHREKVRKIAKIVRTKLGGDKVFFDELFEDELGGDNADTELQRIYGKETLMVVADVSQGYSDRPWCQAEATAIRAFRMTLDTAGDPTQRKRIAYIRFDDGVVPGVLPNAIAWDARKKSENEISKLIIKRLNKLKKELKTGKPLDPKPTVKPDSTPSKSKLWQSIGLGCLLVGIAISMFWFRHDRSPLSTFRILVADIDGPNKGLTGSLIEKLRNETRSYPDITILPLNDKITPQDGPEKAASLALKKDVDLVIWGRNPDSSDYVTLYFQVRSPQMQSVMPAVQQQTFNYSDGDIGTFKIQELVSEKAGSLALYVIAYREMFRGKNSEAFQILTRVVQLNPENSGAHYMLGEISRILSKFDEAESHYSKSIALDANYPYAFLGRGISHFNRGRLAEAVRDCSSAIQLQPTLPDAYSIRGDSYFQLGDITNGISDHTRYLALRTNDPTALVRRAVGYAKLDDYSSAMADLRAAARISKDDYLLKSIKLMLSAMEKILIQNDSLNRTVIGFEWMVTDSNNQTQTNHASGMLFLGAKAFYAVTSAAVASQIETNGFVFFCSASNKTSKISIKDLGERSTKPQIPLWFFEPTGGDCAALPFMFGHSTELAAEKRKLLEYITPVHLSTPTEDTNAPGVGHEITICGMNPAFDNNGLLRLANIHSTVETGLLADARSNKFFLVQGSIPAHHEGGSVLQSLKLIIDMQLNRITVGNVLDTAVVWGMAANHTIPPGSEKQTRVIHRAQIAEFIRGLENTITISWRTNKTGKESM